MNAATFTGGIAPGGIISIFGSGLTSSAGATAVDVDGAAAVLSASLWERAAAAVLNGVELPVSFAGLAPGYRGLSQINVPIPASFVPGLGVSLIMRPGAQASNTVPVAIQ